MFQIGESLREARTRRGFSPADVHKAIRIRERYLTALEEERWDMLPGEAYTKGFLRTYSEYLGLDGQLYVDEYSGRFARHQEDPPPFVPRATAETLHLRRGILTALVGILVVGAGVAGLAAWRLGGSSHPSAARHSAPPAGGTSVGGAPAVVTKPKAPAKPLAPSFALIRATRGRCWLLVRNGGPNGATVFEGVLEQGQAKRFQVSGRLWLRMGRPDALDIHVAGRVVNGLPGTPSNLVLTRAGVAA